MQPRYGQCVSCPYGTRFQEGARGPRVVSLGSELRVQGLRLRVQKKNKAVPTISSGHEIHALVPWRSRSKAQRPEGSCVQCAMDEICEGGQVVGHLPSHAEWVHLGRC